MLLRLLIGEIVKLWNRPDGVLVSPVPFLEDIDDEDDPDSRLLSQYGMLDAD
jgi:hypothetical protein